MLDGFSKQLNRLLVALPLEGLVPFVFELCGELDVAHKKI
jgi:hypothetical protein